MPNASRVTRDDAVAWMHVWALADSAEIAVAEVETGFLPLV